MRTYRDHVRGLSLLETFDSRAFAPDDTYSQQVCDVVLSLALVFNDLKDVLVAHDLLATAAPKERAAISAEVGEYNGLVLHLVRLHSGCCSRGIHAHGRRPIGDDEFAVSIVKLIKHVTFAIHEIVVNFVNGRGFGWRSR
jgi:hypothetical protein